MKAILAMQTNVIENSSSMFSIFPTVISKRIDSPKNTPNVKAALPIIIESDFSVPSLYVSANVDAAKQRISPIPRNKKLKNNWSITGKKSLSTVKKVTPIMRKLHNSNKRNVKYLLPTICFLVTGRVISNVFHPDITSCFSTSNPWTGIRKNGKNKAARSAMSCSVMTSIITAAIDRIMDDFTLFSIV